VIRTMEGKIRKLLDLAMATDNDREAVAAILKARKLDRLRRTIPEDFEGIVQSEAVDLTLAWGKDGSSKTLRNRLAAGSSSAVDEPVPELFTAATEPSVPALVVHHPEFPEDPTPYLGRRTLHGVPHRLQLPAHVDEDEGSPMCPRSEFD